MSNSKPHFDAEDGTPIGQLTQEGYTIEFTPRQLKIVWGKDDRYWQIPNQKGSKLPTKLLQVSWLEVTGSTEGLEQGKYAISFDVEMEAGAFGWSGCPLFMMAKVGQKGNLTWKRLTVPNAGERKVLPSGDKLEITVCSSDKPPIYFGLYEVWTGKWKGGLKIYNAKVRKITA